MDPNRWKVVGDIFHAAQEHPPEQRDAFLASACGGDAELRREVESLLSHDGTQTLFAEPAWARSPELFELHQQQSGAQSRDCLGALSNHQQGRRRRHGRGV
jgi:hypothetical protein